MKKIILILIIFSVNRLFLFNLITPSELYKGSVSLNTSRIVRDSPEARVWAIFERVARGYREHPLTLPRGYLKLLSRLLTQVGPSK